MKLILVLMFFSNFSLTAHATCANRICGSISPIQNENLFKISNITEIVGDGMVWAVSRFHSKNMICRELLKEEGISENASYIRGTLVLGNDEIAFPLAIKNIKTITCKP